MADQKPEQEPSIEEILASIRQIISDDEEQDAPPPPAPVSTPEPVFEPVPVAKPEPEEDVLELNNPVMDELEETPIEIDMQEMPEEEPVFTAAPVTEPPARKPEPATAMDDILTSSARTATISSMAKLAGNMPLTKHREYGNITLEDLVREMLHPMLKDWLSESLPPMVERIVQKELEKLARQAQDV